LRGPLRTLGGNLACDRLPTSRRRHTTYSGPWQAGMSLHGCWPWLLLSGGATFWG
jgi:hypothetical protein